MTRIKSLGLTFAKSFGLAFALSACGSLNAFAQTSPLVFTVAAPARTPSTTVLQASVEVNERGLALWSGAASDFGVGVALSTDRWTIRSISSMTTLPVEGHGRPTFQQIEIVRPVFATASLSVAAGGGVREEWDGTRVLLGRVLAGAEVGPGQLQGSLVVERAVSAALKRDAADLVTSIGWSRRIGHRVSAGFEAIGQDLEGFWDQSETDGGAKLLVGPSLHVQSTRGDWSANLTAGPVVHASSSTQGRRTTTNLQDGRHLGLFVSASWLPALRR